MRARSGVQWRSRWLQLQGQHCSHSSPIMDTLTGDHIYSLTSEESTYCRPGTHWRFWSKVSTLKLTISNGVQCAKQAVLFPGDGVAPQGQENSSMLRFEVRAYTLFGVVCRNISDAHVLCLCSVVAQVVTKTGFCTCIGIFLALQTGRRSVHEYSGVLFGAWLIRTQPSSHFDIWT
jgi:hypothetical protein